MTARAIQGAPSSRPRTILLVLLLRRTLALGSYRPPPLRLLDRCRPEALCTRRRSRRRPSFSSPPRSLLSLRTSRHHQESGTWLAPINGLQRYLHSNLEEVRGPFRARFDSKDTTSIIFDCELN